MKKDERRYYSIEDIEDYNKSFNFLTGARKAGKAKHFERVLDKDDLTKEVTRENELRMLDLNTMIWKKYMHYSNILNESLKYEGYLNNEELSKDEAGWAADSLINSFEDFMYTEDFVFWCEHYNCYQYKKELNWCPFIKLVDQENLMKYEGKYNFEFEVTFNVFNEDDIKTYTTNIRNSWIDADYGYYERLNEVEYDY